MGAAGVKFSVSQITVSRMNLSNMFCTDIKFFISTPFTQIQQSFGARDFFLKTHYERRNSIFKKLERYDYLPFDFDQLEVRTQIKIHTHTHTYTHTHTH